MAERTRRRPPLIPSRGTLRYFCAAPLGRPGGRGTQGDRRLRGGAGGKRPNFASPQPRNCVLPRHPSLQFLLSPHGWPRLAYCSRYIPLRGRIPPSWSKTVYTAPVAQRASHALGTLPNVPIGHITDGEAQRQPAKRSADECGGAFARSAPRAFRTLLLRLPRASEISASSPRRLHVRHNVCRVSSRGFHGVESSELFLCAAAAAVPSPHSQCLSATLHTLLSTRASHCASKRYHCSRGSCEKEY